MGAGPRLIPSQKMTVIENPARRLDRQGQWVKDQAVLECSSKHPNPILYSVIPKGDIPPSKQKGQPGGSLLPFHCLKGVYRFID